MSARLLPFVVALLRVEAAIERCGNRARFWSGQKDERSRRAYVASNRMWSVAISQWNHFTSFAARKSV
jgi:hypothetical protein